jgi:triacylglycerol esterase/lipase EstA (alpha/beta hydrolase family)
MFARLVLLFLVAAFPAAAQDYAREKRWADEVVPALVVGDAVWLEVAAGRKYLAIYTPATKPKGAVVIVHGIGVHPDHGMIGVLRAKLTDLGWSTLSVQMPVQAADARSEAYYPALFPEAIDRIARASAWLVAKDGPRVAIVSHSLGAWMTNAYFDETAASPFKAWACLGLTGGYSLATWFSPRPILDVYGENDLESSVSAAWRRGLTLASAAQGSRQVMIAGADHFYAGKEDELARTISGWLAEVLR